MIVFLADVRNHKLLLVLGLIASVFLLLGRFYVTKSVIGGDAVYYYMNVRSLVMDRDLNFQNEYTHFYSEISVFTGNRKIHSIPGKNLLTGRLPNKYPIGSAIALIPFFIAGHVLTLCLQKVGLSISADGYGSVYQLSVGIGSLIYAFAGIGIIYNLGKRLYDPAIALIGAIAIWMATPLIYYMTMEPLMAHAISTFCVALFVFLWYVTRGRQTVQWVILGLMGGLTSIVRYQDALFLLIPAIDAMIAVIYRRNSLQKSRLYPVFALCVFLTVASLVIFLQLYANKLLYGSFFTTGYSQEKFAHYNSPKLFQTLFSTQGGLLLWSPVIAFSLIGLFWFSRKHLFGSLLLFSFLLQWYLISSWWAPSQGDSFGSRMLLNSTIIFALGLMQFLDTLQKRNILKPAVGLCGGFILINGILMGLYCLRIIGHPYHP